MKNIKLNALTNMLVRILNIVFPLITGPYISRVLSKEDFGNFNVANTILNLFIPFATLGIYNYGMREISKVKNDRDKINKVFSQLFYISLICTIATTIIYYIYVSFTIDTPDLRYLYYILGVQLFSQLFYIEWLNEAFENYKFIFYKTLVIRILMLVAVFMFVKKAEDIIPYTIVMSVITLINFLASFVWIKREVKFVRVHVKDMMKMMSPLFAVLLIANANMLYTYLDQIFLSKIGIVENVTYYVTGYNIATLLARVVSGAVSVSVPRLGYYLGIGDRKAYQDLVNKGSQAFFFFLVPICVGLASVGIPVTLLYGGEKYFFAGMCTVLFAIRTIGWALEIIFGTQVILVNGYEERLTVLYFVGGGINLLLNSVLFFTGVTAPEYYIITTMAAEIVLLLLEYVFIRNMELVRVKPILHMLKRYIVLSLGFVPIAFVVNHFVPYGQVVDKQLLLNIGLTVISSVIYYLVALAIAKDDLYQSILKGVLSKLKIGAKS